MAPGKLPTWNLKSLISNENEIRAIQTRIQKQTQTFAAQRKTLEQNPTREKIEHALEQLETIGREGSRISSYAHLAFAADTTDQAASALESQLSQFSAEQSNHTVFFGLWWKNLDEKTTKKLLPRNPDHAYHLKDSRRFKHHLLSEKEEQLATLKDTTGEEALVRLYEMITNAYQFPWTKNGKRVLLNEEELSTHRRSPDPRERVRAYDLAWNKYRADNATLGEIYKNIALDAWNEGVSLRKFETPLAMRNMDNHLPDTMVESFLRVCEENTDIFQDYFAWKSNFLGIKNSRYHVYAPLGKISTHYPFDAAYSRVIHTFNQFAPWFAHEAHRVRKEKRMDAGIRPGKRSGAFCMDIPGQTSYVHLNYTGTLNDVSTLAHELGHAVHHHTAGHHSIFTRSAVLPLAETASTFAELLLSEQLLAESKNESFTRTLLAHQLEDAFATIQRQAYFSRFEETAFNMIREGTTVPDLNAAYAKTLHTQFGKRMEIPEAAHYEWTAIPHFFVHPFYVYAYAFGQLLVYALYQRYQKEGESFVRDYKKFLAYGGSAPPEKMLHEMGFDANKRKSWQNGFTFVRTKLKTLQKMGSPA